MDEKCSNFELQLKPILLTDFRKNLEVVFYFKNTPKWVRLNTLERAIDIK